MEFSNYLFIFIFFPITVLLFFLIPPKIKKYYLAAISVIYFSLASIESLSILILSIIINYVIGLVLGGNKYGHKKIILIGGITLNVATLFLYKYTNFFISNLNSIFHLKISEATLILPLGLSFFIFQNISYLVDIYNKKINSEKNIVNFLLYTCYFPRVVNGPIVKYEDFHKEIDKLGKTSIDNVYAGMKRFSFGMAKVLIISSTLGTIWSQIVKIMDNTGITPLTAWFGIICYSLYLFSNFSGYIDIAIGISKIYGITLPENFNYPYYSASISEFWRRWHITLGAWFREYIYIPLGGNKKGNVYIHLMIVFLLTGLWHGSSWNFIAWGVFNGIFIVIERAIRDKKFYTVIPNYFKRIFTYLIILMGWVLFANDGLLDSINYFKVMFGLKSFEQIQYSLKYFLTYHNIFFVVLATIIALPIKDWVINRINNKKMIEIISGVFAVSVLSISIIYLINSSYSPSLYAQF